MKRFLVPLLVLACVSLSHAVIVNPGCSSGLMYDVSKADPYTTVTLLDGSHTIGFITLDEKGELVSARVHGEDFTSFDALKARYPNVCDIPLRKA